MALIHIHLNNYNNKYGKYKKLLFILLFFCNENRERSN